MAAPPASEFVRALICPADTGGRVDDDACAPVVKGIADIDDVGVPAADGIWGFDATRAAALPPGWLAGSEPVTADCIVAAASSSSSSSMGASPEVGDVGISASWPLALAAAAAAALSARVRISAALAGLSSATAVGDSGDDDDGPAA